jgi:hypothetical protein
MRSEQINELAVALAKAQAAMKPAVKDRKNPHLGNTYATLDSIIESIRKPLSDNSLSFMQPLQQTADGIILETWLLHASGQFFQSEVLVNPMSGNRGVNEMQALGSSLTYMRRYALESILGLNVDDDDDGNASKPASKQAQPKTQLAQAKATPPPQAKPTPTNGHNWIDKLSGQPRRDFAIEVNEKTGGFYKSEKALLEAITDWNHISDDDARKSKLNAAVDHANEDS